MDLKTLADLRFIFMDRPKMSGSAIDPEAAECIRFADWFVPLIIEGTYQGIYFHIVNEGTFSKGGFKPVWANLLKAMGKIAGAPDYVFMWGPNGGLIEFKRPDGKGKMSEKQEAVERICGRVKIRHAVCDTAEEAREVLIGWGALKGNVVELPPRATPIG